MDDRRIIELFFERSEQAIAELSDKYGAVFIKVADNILNNRQDAEECVNDSYLGVWNTVPPVNPDSLLSYVCKIVRNQAIKKYRSNTAIKRNSYYDVALDELEDVFPSHLSVEDEIVADEIAKTINRFLGGLDSKSRIMFVRRYWHCDSVENLAMLFHTDNHNITVRLSRIRKKLKKYLLTEGTLQ